MNKVSLGDYADMEVPAGYHFVAAGPARVLLERMNNPVAPGLLGVLAPQNGNWLAVLEFDEIGYLKNPGAQHIDTAAILKAIEDRHAPGTAEDPARIASVRWDMEPKYDTDAHSLEWGLRAQAQSGEILNHVLALLGRRGVLEITVVQPYRPEMNSVPLNQLVKAITFKADQGYADYRSGDKVASAGFKDLIVGDESPSAHQDEIAAGSIPGVVTWIYAAVGGVAVVGLGFFTVKKLKTSKRRPVVAATNGHATVAPFKMNGNGNGNGHRNGKKIAHANGNGAGRKKKMFNYTKYYTDMVMGLSGNTYAWVSPSNGNSDNPRSRAAQSLAQPPTPPAPQAAVPTGAQPATPTTHHAAVTSANLELIASQRNLIEEQRNLMREQSRLIEEKARLLKEYNQLVEKWSQDFGTQFSLKLD